MKQRQLFYYNRHAKPLKSIEPGETIRMRWPGQSTWSAGTCTGVVGPKSYEVQVGEGRYRQNRRHLIRSNETQADHPMDNPEIMVDSETVDNSVRDSQEVDKSGSESAQKRPLPRGVNPTSSWYSSSLQIGTLTQATTLDERLYSFLITQGTHTRLVELVFCLFVCFFVVFSFLWFCFPLSLSHYYLFRHLFCCCCFGRKEDVTSSTI